ncbi:MAG TPA: histidine phosphatase family protein [Tepidisphaeraceae bacterium]|nr:histidine phosphatase family protein [Tepidisphaeraceae bacterium]
MRSLHVLLVRHGQTDSNLNGVLQGHSPTPLNTLGRAQAKQVARRLKDWESKIDVLVSSDLPRAAQTAEAISAELAMPIQFDPRWRELSFGELEGRAVGEKEIWRNAGGEVEAPGGEKAIDFQKRIVEALVGLREEFASANTICVVTHGGPCRLVPRLLNSGVLERAADQVDLNVPSIINCSIMHLTHDADGWRVMCVNEASHLDLETAKDEW